LRARAALERADGFHWQFLSQIGKSVKILSSAAGHSAARRALIPKQFLELIARGGFTRVAFIPGDELPFDEVEVLAKICRVFFRHWLSAAIPALMRRARIVAGAIQAHAQISATTVTRFAPARLAADRPFPSAFVTMTRHKLAPKVSTIFQIANCKARRASNSVFCQLNGNGNAIQKCRLRKISPFVARPIRAKVCKSLRKNFCSDHK
jgi:hypothetical protein